MSDLYALDYLGTELYDGDRIIFIGEDARFHMGTIFLSDEEDSILTSSNSYLLQIGRASCRERSP